MPTEAEQRKTLVLTHLYYDLATESLKSRAIAEFITKILFLSPGKKAKFKTISEELAKLIGVQKLFEQDITSGILLLKDRGLIKKYQDEWILSKETISSIENNLQASATRINLITSKYFSHKIESDTLKSWFQQAGIDFFSRYGEIWTKSFYQKGIIQPLERKSLSQILQKSIQDAGLEAFSEDLIGGFRAFLDDIPDPQCSTQLWAFSQAMFSAKLITATIGPDPLTIEEFTGAKFFLDTNILVVASLEKDYLADAFSEFANSLAKIETSLHFLNITKSEYSGVVYWRQQETLKALKEFPLEIIAESEDPFIKTAISRGCENEGDFIRFFDSINEPNQTIGQAKINFENDEKIIKAVSDGSRDPKRREDIQAEWLKFHTDKKAPHAVNHDAGLDGAVDYLKGRGEKIWVITADRSMQNLSARWAGSAGLPTWISLDALIQLLAIKSTGPNHNPENYAPLLSTIIKADLQTNSIPFSPEDLNTLHDLEESITELSSEEIICLAKKVARLRFTGRAIRDPEISYEIRKAFRRKRDGGEQIINLQRDILELKQQQEEQKQKSFKLLYNQIRPSVCYKIYGGFSASILLILFFGLFLLWLAYKFYTKNHPSAVTICVMISLTQFLFPLFKYIIPGLKNSAKKIDEKTKIKAENLMGNL